MKFISIPEKTGETTLVNLDQVVAIYEDDERLIFVINNGDDLAIWPERQKLFEILEEYLT